MGVLPDWMIEKDVGIKPFAPQEDRPGKVSYGVTSYGYDCRLGYKFKVFKPYPCSVIDPKKFDDRMLEEVDLTPCTHNFQCSGGHEMQGMYTCMKCLYWTHYPSEHPVGVPEPMVIPPHSFILAESLEEFDIPRDVLCVVLGKSTYARCGLIVNVTPLEPEWKGKVTIEISNTTPLPAKVYPGEGIMQCVFLRTDGIGRAALKTLEGLISDLLVAEPAFSPMRSRIENTLELLGMYVQEGECKKSYKDKKGRYQNQTGVTNPFVK